MYIYIYIYTYIHTHIYINPDRDKPWSRFASACAAHAFGATSDRDSVLCASRDSALRASDSISNSLRSALLESKFQLGSKDNPQIYSNLFLSNSVWNFNIKYIWEVRTKLEFRMKIKHGVFWKRGCLTSMHCAPWVRLKLSLPGRPPMRHPHALMVAFVIHWAVQLYLLYLGMPGR